MKTSPILNNRHEAGSARSGLSLLATAALLLAAAPSAWAGNGNGSQDPRVLPPKARVEGRSLTDWKELFHIYGISDAPINSVPWMNVADVQIGQVLMLAGTWGAPKQITVRPGTFLYVPVAGCWGELYDDGHTDTPDSLWNGFPNKDWPLMVTASATLDGKPVSVNMADYFSPITWFDEPIMYAEASGYGSIGAVWVQAFGLVIKPLSPGVHTFATHVVDNFFFAVTDDVWTITVLP